jgi:hypothetical protein
MARALDVLDGHNVYYRIKFSGHRSLHLMIPAEAFPKTFHDRSVNEQFDLIEKKIHGYLPYAGHTNPGQRVVYSTHPKGAMVSIPLRREELPNFRPWMANIYTVVVDFDWFQVPQDAVERNERFLHTIFDSQQKRVTMRAPVFKPLPVKAYTGEVSISDAEVLQGIDSDYSQERVAAARAALIQNLQLPPEKLRRLFYDTEPDARWFGLEIALRDAFEIAIENVIHLFGQEDDYLVGLLYQRFNLSSRQVVDAICDYLMNQDEISQNLIVAARMIVELNGLDSSRVVRLFIESESSSKIAHVLQKAINSGPPFDQVRDYIRLLRDICKRCHIKENIVFSEARKLLMPQLLNYLSEENGNPDYISIAKKSLVPQLLCYLSERKAKPGYVSILIEVILGNASGIVIEDIINLLRQEDDYLNGLGYQLLNPSTVQMDGVCDYLISQGHINRNTVAIARAIRELDEQSFVELPMRIRVTSLHEWFEKVWVVCASAICLDWRPSLKILFENAYLQAKRYKANDEEVADKIHQLELLFQLYNREAHTRVQDAPLFSAAEALIQYGRDLRPIVMALLDCEPSNNVYYGAIRLLTRLWWNDSIDLLIQRLDCHSSRRKSVLKTIVDIGAAAVPKLIQALKDKNMRGFVPASLFAEIGEPAVAGLIEALKDEEREVRWHAACALGKLGELAKSAVPSLIELLSDENEEVRSHATRALKLIGTSEAIKQ